MVVVGVAQLFIYFVQLVYNSLGRNGIFVCVNPFSTPYARLLQKCADLIYLKTVVPPRQIEQSQLRKTFNGCFYVLIVAVIFLLRLNVQLKSFVCALRSGQVLNEVFYSRAQQNNLEFTSKRVITIRMMFAAKKFTQPKIPLYTFDTSTIYNKSTFELA